MEYNPECIAMVTNLLTPDRVNVMWLSKSFSAEHNVQEKWFGINYSIHGNESVHLTKLVYIYFSAYTLKF